ncbi:hypothetical protein PG994_008420 [Apiospora phragmitis]|uniref:Uncharacterized protein n=1 Tax=Apiospora phragmitis TaxID=2905665 RepID=A0ABR1USZ3_9PEZI
MGCFNSKSALGGPDGREFAAHYRTILINKLDNPMIAMSKRIEVEEELDRFMGFSEREQEIYAWLRLAPAARPVVMTETPPAAAVRSRRPKTMHSSLSSNGSMDSTVSSSSPSSSTLDLDLDFKSVDGRGLIANAG